jgi:hypothetical protein
MPSCRVDDVHIALDGLRTHKSTLTEDGLQTEILFRELCIASCVKKGEQWSVDGRQRSPVVELGAVRARRGVHYRD